MKIPTLLFPLLLLISQSAVSVQDDKRQGPDIDQLVSQLDLSTDQSTRLKAIMSEHRQQMESMREQMQEERQEMHKIRTQHREELLTVLNYEQLYKFDQYMHQFRPRRANKSNSQQ